MEDAFNTLKDQGKNNVDGVIQWMKDAKIIDGKAITEDKVRQTFGDVSGAVEVDKFKEVLEKLAKDGKGTVDLFVNKLCDTGAVVEGAFEKLKREGKNNVDNLVQWMKDSKLIDSAKESEAKARQLLSDTTDKTNVELERFKDAVHQMAEESQKGLSNIVDTIKEEAPRLLGAFQAATSAFKDAMNK